jgi:predicted hydrolase (HD superfamily)
MAKHFGADEEHWMALGYLHDYDYEQYPDEHLRHTEEPLLAAGTDPKRKSARSLLTAGADAPTSSPVTECEKSLYTVDELTGIIGACARMRPNGLTDLTVSSFMKKFKGQKICREMRPRADKERLRHARGWTCRRSRSCVSTVCVHMQRELGLEGTAHQS